MFNLSYMYYKEYVNLFKQTESMILLEMMGYDIGTIFIDSYLYSDLIL